MNKKREVNNTTEVPRRRVSDERDEFEESLLLFKELQKRGNDDLLQPIPDEFEANGRYALYRMASGKRGAGFSAVAETGENDYDWLKTPPATPLFPSLEMETNAPPELVMQRELPIFQPLSRFASNSGTSKAITKRSPSPNPKPELPIRHLATPIKNQITPIPDKKNMKDAPRINSKPNHSKKETSSASSFGKTKESPKDNFQAPRLVPKISPPVAGFLNKTPPNLLRAERSISACRGQRKQQEPIIKGRRQSCSPGRHRIVANNANVAHQAGNNKSHVVGSKMVDKFLNARKPSSNGGIQSRVAPKSDGSLKEVSGFARLVGNSSRYTKGKIPSSMSTK